MVNDKKKDDYFAPCAICGKPVYKPILDVWPWKCFARNSKKTLWFCSEKCFLQWKQDNSFKFHPEGLPEDPDDAPKKRKPYHEHYYIAKVDTGTKTLAEILKDKDIAQKELAFKVGLKMMKFRACLYGHNAWPRSIVDKICKILEINFEDVKWERINEGK